MPDLEMDHEIVNVVAQDMIEFSSALDEVKTYAHGDDLVPDQFGNLADTIGVGETFAGVRDALRGSLDHAVPVVAAMAKALGDSASWTTEADAAAALGITRAGG